MRVALVHDYLNQYGGGERVLEVLMEMFPEAPVFTLFHDEKATGGRFAGRVAKTSFLDFSFARENHRAFIPLMPLAAGSIDLGADFDLIISDTAGYAKGIKYGPKTKHVAYVHTPLRYAWEAGDYLKPWLASAAGPVLDYLKRWDFQTGQRPDALIANSGYIAGKIKNYYKREAKIIYPPVDDKKFYREIGSSRSKAPSYYLAAGRLLHYKRFDLIIQAFARLGYWLKIAGSGRELDNLKKLRDDLGAVNVEFLPFAGDEELRKLYNGAKAVIFPQTEDFGLVAAEAQSCGAPVIAYGAGGALEIVEDGVSGVFFREQSPEALAAAVENLNEKKWSRLKIARSAKRFSKEQFKKQIFDTVKSLG